MVHEMHDSVRPHHLTRIRVQLAIYFCLHRGSLPEHTAGGQSRFRANPPPQKFRKNYVSAKTAPRYNVREEVADRWLHLSLSKLTDLLGHQLSNLDRQRANTSRELMKDSVR